MPSAAERAGFNMISAVTPLGVLHFDVFTGRFDATIFVEFLKKLMHDAPGPVFLILDNHSVHKARLVRDYVASLRGRLKLFFLPPYAPELNPDEWVWKNVKHDQVGRAAVTRQSEF
ncbi:transposase [Pseudonocardia sp. HH130630-07]|uniref:transposase n=1 Tax=Pseudonocardia sp. HH130630-07 TaxID=1690815 RepID=UPI0012EA0CE2